MSLPHPETPPPLPPAPRKGWLARNWKWFVPTVCLAGLAAFAGLMALVLTLVFGLIKSSEPYEQAVARAMADPTVQRALGTPIETGFLVTGNINTSGASGQASLSIPISGPNDEATIYVEATKSAGQWAYSFLAVRIHDAGEQVVLVGKDASESRESDWHQP